MGSSEIVGGAIGAVILLAVIAVGLHRVFVAGPRRRATETDRVAGMTGLVQRLNATVHTAQSGTRPSFGVLPEPRYNHASDALRPIEQFDQAVEFAHRNHQVLGVDYTYNVRAIEAGRSVVRWLQNNIVQVRTPPTPRLRISARKPAGLTYRGDELTVFQLGNARFDDVFEVAAADERFARTVLTGPVLDLLLYGSRYRDKFLEFDEGVVRSEFAGRLDADVLLANADLLIDFVERLPAQAWQFR
ncbi:hypothetical protein DI005_05030 [Prauserella sp. PE36]|uniref:Uncharacterized protein n=1 Tax=Prauserella endophytica TaxID=1592324 RepID=A0ABY2S0I1_9PSEU|nr:MULTISPECIES: hypothetical protein [Prauserella]RBM22806.1 hypothetical protein DI005_05030 [Prauserella sp. PE36]TKG67588.1 hypothetical protein FCN18_22810 [Prauserella endophytica]